MAKAKSQQWPRFVPFAVAGLLLVCVTLSGMVIARSESTLEGVAGIGLIVATGLLYAMLAVRADERAQRERQDCGRD